jgi:hypothetical protein
MSATVFNLSEFRNARRASAKAAPVAVDPVAGSAATKTAEASDFCFWSGASGDRYVHHIYSLIECPELPASNYVLVGRDDSGRRKVLHVGRTTNVAASLNLAEIRMRGAQLGACEVHVHLLAENDGHRRLVDLDLRTGLFADGQSRTA